MESDTQQLAHLVSITYLPQFKKDIENCEDENIKQVLEQRYKEVETLCNKYLDI